MPNNTMTIFVADDSAAVRRRLIKLLSYQDQVQVIGQADNTMAAIEGIRRLKPQVVILDIRMPGGSGIDVLQAVKKQSSAPVAIMLTNYSYPQYKQKCFEAGADYFFDKSKEFDKLPEVLDRLARQGHA